MGKGQQSAPLLEAMRAYASKDAVAFHTPGHKQGKGIHRAFREIITATGLAMEVSLADELDDLFAPSTCIKAAQDLAAELYDADVTHFVVNGTTGAIQLMMMAALNPGDAIILPRNVHRSVLGAVMLIGARPIFMRPEVDEELGIAATVSFNTLADTLRLYPESKAVLLVNPTYYGMACDLVRAAELVHQYDMVLLIDEAHGAHLKFSDALPLTAMEAGADMAAQSTHKLLGALTQTSMLHVKLARVDEKRVQRMNGVVQSTSPNYLLLASLDVARMQMAVAGSSLLGKAVELAQWAREEINRIVGLYCFGAERAERGGFFALDLTKLTVTVKALGLSGAEAGRILWKIYGIQPELSDCYNVLFIISIGDSEAEIRLLINALSGLAANHRKVMKQEAGRLMPPEIPAMRLLPREALFADKCTLLFSGAAGKTSGEIITFYPPGIPLVWPGEIITQAVIDYCLAMKKIGLNIVGPDDTTLEWIKVVK